MGKMGFDAAFALTLTLSPEERGDRSLSMLLLETGL